MTQCNARDVRARDLRVARGLDETTLVAGCIAAVPAAQQVFVERFRMRVMHAVRRAGDRFPGVYTESDADDLCAEVFALLFADQCRRLQQFEGRNGARLGSWLHVVAMRLTHNALRSRRVHVHRDGLTTLVDPAPSAQEQLEALAERPVGRRLDSLAKELSESERALFRLLRQGVRPAAAAAALSIRPGALYTRKTRLLGRLRALARSRRRRPSPSSAPCPAT